MVKFYDTCSLLQKGWALGDDKYFVISSVTLQELENIKTSIHKDNEIKAQVREVLNYLGTHHNYYIHLYKPSMLEPVLAKGFEESNDTKILATAFDYDNTLNPDNTIFISEDFALREIANLFFGEDSITSVEKYEPDDYSGYLDIYLNDEELSMFYSDGVLPYDMYINQYLIIRDENGEVIDRRIKTANGFEPIKFKPFSSDHFGNVHPMSNDSYQMFAADSFLRNKLTMIKGPAGTGKTYLSLGFLLSQLEHHKIDKIIVFCNTVATKNSARLGFYPGTRDEKLLDSQIGNLLSSKFGDKSEVERMIAEGDLVLLPLSDIRGFDTSGMRAGIYISEAQNLDVSLMKLAIQRIGEDSICIVDGDAKTQVDDSSYAGTNNGMRRLSKVFRGEDIYGEIELKNIHRSRLANIAEKM